jgi:hypothetical protein
MNAIKVLVLFFSLIFTHTASAEIYKWVDDHGVTHYSDSPHVGATQVELPKIEVYKAKAQEKPIEAETKSEKASNEDADFPYQELEISSPQNDGSVRDNQGNVTVKVSTIPKLRATDRIILYLDGQKIAGPQQKTTFKLYNVDRGEHELAAEIVDQNDKGIIRSSSITFFMIRILIPANRPQSP